MNIRTFLLISGLVFAGSTIYASDQAAYKAELQKNAKFSVLGAGKFGLLLGAICFACAPVYDWMRNMHTFKVWKSWVRNYPVRTLGLFAAAGALIEGVGTLRARYDLRNLESQQT